MKKDQKEYQKLTEAYEKVEEGEHWSQMPAAKTLHNFKKAISDLEPAGDVREWYVDAADAGVDTRVLDKILVAAVKEGDLHRAEAHFIKTGSQDHPDQDPSDVGHRGFDKEQVEVEGGGASAQEMNAWRQVVDGLRSGRIDLKEVEQGAGTIVVSTGDEKSVILKVMGFEDDHDVPVSMRPDRGPDRDSRIDGVGGSSPRERSRREMGRGQTPSRFGPTGDDARDFD